MNHFDYKILILLSFISCYYIGLKPDNNPLAQISTELKALVYYSENINKTLSSDHSEMTFEEWYKKCKKLPYYRIIGSDFSHQAIEWNEFNKTIDKFIEVNTEILSHENKWIENSPKLTDSFFTTKDKPLDQIQPFVQKLVIDPDMKVAFHGDFHGDVHSMIEYIQRLNTDKLLNGFKIIDPKCHLVFLGDYEDRGNYGAEVWYTLMRLKIANPNNVIIVRGNHEDIEVCFGFWHECEAKFKIFDLSDFFRITKIFDFLPVALYLGSGTNELTNYLLCVHGGLNIYQPDRNVVKSSFDSHQLLSSKSTYQWLKTLPNDKFPANYFKIGFMWNDFQVSPMEGTVFNPGRGYMCGKADTENYLKSLSNPQAQFELKGIFRAHQHSTAPDRDFMIEEKSLMQMMIKGDGIAKLWPDETNKNKNLWNNIVCTFLVAPDTPYGKNHKYNWDGFGILTTAEKFEDWKLEMQKNKVLPQS